ncbi:MAG TPA: L-histidine N(alpha)-methyltransferase [Dongiaceae bacterium]|nr:L-histidine N(alpha)-methyltransferase [Dongiaceae bacterium]
MGTHTLTATKPNDFALLVREGLTKRGQKELPSKYLYDDVGSALFDLICLLPEYGLTRAEERILSAHAQEIVSQLPESVAVAELGSGSGKKTRLLLEALCRRSALSYYPIEISPKALATCERELSDIRCINVVGLEREYLDGLLEVTARRGEQQHLLVLFLGSTLGNFDGPAGVRFLQQLRGILWPGDYLLLGADLCKPKDLLLAAYDDSLGVTAAFNRNLLARINRELGGEFVLNQFAHEAVFNEDTHSVEMHLRSLSDQEISIAAAGIEPSFADGETIWTETSHKYSLAELNATAAHSGFQPQGIWIDDEWPFADCLWRVK